MRWEPHHTWTDGATERVDGFLTYPLDGFTQQLDIACFGDECCTDDPRELVERAWAEGRVFLSWAESHGVPTLVVPTAALTTDLIHEAVRRFRP